MEELSLASGEKESCSALIFRSSDARRIAIRKDLIY